MIKKVYKYTAVVTFSVLVEQSAGKTTKQLFEKKLKHVLEFTQKHAGEGCSNFAILPRYLDDKKTPQIRSYKDFPEHQIVYQNKYFKMENNWGFADLNKFVNRRNIRGSMRVGADYDVASVLSDVGVHLGTDVKAYIKHKGVQLMETFSGYILLGVGEAVSLDRVREVVNDELEVLDSEVCGGEAREKIIWSVDHGFPDGMPFRPRKEGEAFADSGRRGFIFMVAGRHVARFGEILELAKKNRTWTRHWGQRALTIKMVPAYRKNEPVEHTSRRPLYQEIVRRDGAANLSTGYAVFPAIRNIDAKFTLRRTDADGNAKKRLRGLCVKSWKRFSGMATMFGTT